MDDIDRFLSSLDMFASPTIDAGIAQARSRELLREHGANITTEEALSSGATTASPLSTAAVSSTPSHSSNSFVNMNDSNTNNHCDNNIITANSSETGSSGRTEIPTNHNYDSNHHLSRKRARYVNGMQANQQNAVTVSSPLSNNNLIYSSNNENYSNGTDENSIQGQAIDSAVDKQWICSRCTLINKSGNKRCEACNGLRSKFGLPYAEDISVINMNKDAGSSNKSNDVNRTFDVSHESCESLPLSTFPNSRAEILLSDNDHNNSISNNNESDDSSSSSSDTNSDNSLSELSDTEDDIFHTPHSESNSEADEGSNNNNLASHTVAEESNDNAQLVHFLQTLRSVTAESLPLATLPASMSSNGQLEPFQLQALHWMLEREHRLRKHNNNNNDNNNNNNYNLLLSSSHQEGHSYDNVFNTLSIQNDTSRYEEPSIFCINNNNNNKSEEYSCSSELASVKGGILADYMGLGKTRSLLALCESTRGPRTDRVTGSLVYSSATLIIAPTSVLSQWVMEIKRCVQPTPRVLIYYGSRKKKLSLFAVAQEYDYVLTSYHSVRHEPSPVAGWNTAPGKLYMIQWQRIILDEAHHIRNLRTQQCKACLRLTGINKWVVTATPVQNSVNDLFPLLKFLAVPYFGNLTWWNREIVRYLRRSASHPRPTTALKMLFASLLLRRTPSSRISGEPILHLPEKRVITTTVTLSQSARGIYNSIYRNATSKLGLLQNEQQQQQQQQQQEEEEQQQHYNQRNRTREISTSHTLCQFSTAFEMLLRCRQSCLHPYIAVAALRRARGQISAYARTQSTQNFNQAQSTPNNSTANNSNDNSNNANNNNNTKAKLQNNMNNAKDVKMRDALMETFITRTLLRKLKDKNSSFVAELTEELKNYKLGERECIICLETVHTPVILPCAHVFCHQCITHAIELQHRCPMCKRKTQTRELLIVPEEVLLSANNVLVTLPEINVDDYNNWDEQLSAKTVALLNAIESIPHNEKIVVFSSFVTYLTYLQHCLQRRHIPCVLFTGKLTLKEKDVILERFSRPIETNVLENNNDNDNNDQMQIEEGNSPISSNRPELELQLRNELLTESNNEANQHIPFTTSAATSTNVNQYNNDNDNNNNIFVIDNGATTSNVVKITQTEVVEHEQQQEEQPYNNDRACHSNENTTLNNSNPRVLLATISTCGVGITLTAANHCFLMEPTWNPAQEEQAMNRIHRIGQTKPVTITRFITDDTVETRIDALCQQKKKLEGFIGSGQGGGVTRLTLNDLLTLFVDEKEEDDGESESESESESVSETSTNQEDEEEHVPIL